MQPPFLFPGMTLQVFPLQAKLDTLQSFVDSYLNSAFPQGEAGYFRVLIPYFYLMVLNYGNMSDKDATEGWVAQREILFNIPLAWYFMRNGTLTFYDWAQVAPFIFVDNEISVNVGREVYGWPKTLVRLNTASSSWMTDPTSPLQVASLKTSILPMSYVGARPEELTLLEFYKSTSDAFFQFPPAEANPYIPLVYMNRLLGTSSSWASGAFRLLHGMHLLGRQRVAVQPSLDAMCHGLLRLMTPNARNVGFNCINLKQFRSTENPEFACYKGITNSRMSVQQITRGGPLGGQHQLMGDPSGNIQILLHRYASLPIAETLGLKSATATRAGNGNIQELRPLFPFWLELDMTYGEARTVAERALSSHEMKTAVTAFGVNESPMRIRTSGGTVAQELLGPVMYPNSTLRVMPLLAHEGNLRAFCDACLNDTLRTIQGGLKVRFEPWGPYIYLVATNHEDIIATQNDVGRFKDKAASFYMPVRMYVKREGDDKEKLHTVAILPILSYANNSTVANSESEVLGVPTTFAQVTSPPSTWMNALGPSATTPHNLLRVTTQVIPGTDQGQQAVDRTLLEISSQAPLHDMSSGSARESWRQSLAHDFQKRVAVLESPRLADSRGLALEVMGGGFPLNVITLKQFRDATNPDEACYQALVQFEQRLEQIYDVREIESSIHVHIHDFPSQRIVETLGLVSTAVDYQGQEIVYTLQPVRPFWMTVSMSSSLGRALLRRYDSNQWSTLHFWGEPTYFDGGLQEYVNELSDLLEQTELRPQELAAQVKQWKQANIVHDERTQSVPAIGKLPIQDPTNVVEELPPQWIIEQVLSREWEHRGESRWHLTTQQLQDKIKEEEAGKAPLSRKRITELAASFRKPDFCLPARDLPRMKAEHGTFEGQFIFLRSPTKPAPQE